jgi:hypothetical protein
LPENRDAYRKFERAMQQAGFDPSRGLETVQVGNLEYDMAVFTSSRLGAASDGTS